MRVGWLLFGLWVAGCRFHTDAVAPKEQEAPGRNQDGGASARDAATGMDSGAPGPDGRTDAMTGPVAGGGGGGPLADGGEPDADMLPPPPDSGPQVGGLKCGDVFCPFTRPPIEPCCTTASDVKSGAARAEDRCGLNFTATGSDYFADHCWQRDQPGVVDDACPDVNVDLRSSEPGCCTEQGACGALNTEHAIGCHLDPYATSQQSCGTTEVDGGTGPVCDLRGVYALRMTVDLAWGGRSGGLFDLTDDGRGTLVIDMRLDVTGVDEDTLALEGTIEPCGVELPAFYSTTLCEAYQPVFPTMMWESAKMPSFPVHGQLSCAAPGCIASLDAHNVLLGISLDNPEAPWPTANETRDITCPAGKGMQCFPDHDGDGRPGVTVQVAKQGTLRGGTGCERSGYARRGAPLRSSVAAIFGGVRRTDRVHLGVRMRIGGAFALAGDECASGVGSGVAEFVNSRAWSCMVQPGTFDYPNGARAGANEPCTAQQAAFMDANLPVYEILALGQQPPSNLELADKSPSAGPRLSMVRLAEAGANVSCADVRAAEHP